MQKEPTHIYGKHPVLEALLYRPEAVKGVFLQEGTELSEIANTAKEAGILVSNFKARQLPGGLSETVTHQGAIAELDSSKLMVSYKDFIEQLSVSEDTSLLVFGEVQDPHNVGAAIRSASAFGVSGVLIPPHKQSQVNGTVIKVSAGTAFRVPLVDISNVNTALRDLKERGFWIYGLDGEGETKLTEEQFTKPSVFVLGNEGEGLRKMTKEECDLVLSIPISTQAESMNASASVAVVLYEWSRQHPKALNK